MDTKFRLEAQPSGPSFNPANTWTHHIIEKSGEIAAFISFRVMREELDDLTVIYFSVEYIYVVQRFRRHGLGKRLLEPLVEEVQAVLHQATNVDRRKSMRLQSASHPESSGGSRLLRELELQAWRLASTYVGVVLVGRYCRRRVEIASYHRRRAEDEFSIRGCGCGLSIAHEPAANITIEPDQIRGNCGRRISHPAY